MTDPAASSATTTVPIDCGRMLSALAKPEVVRAVLLQTQQHGGQRRRRVAGVCLLEQAPPKLAAELLQLMCERDGDSLVVLACIIDHVAEI